MVRLPIEQSQIWNFRLLLIVKPDSMLVPTFSFDVLLIDSKLTTFHNVLAACNDIHHISVKTTSNSIPFIHLGGPCCPLGPSSGILSCCSFLVTPLHQILPRWGHPCLLMGMRISSIDRTHCSLIKLPQDLLAPCNSCLLVVLENHLPVHFWLVNELSKL
jgi:hypothetical protein